MPCGEQEFDWGNDGWHPGPACSMRLRRHLDGAAAQQTRPRLTSALVTTPEFLRESLAS